MTQEQALSEFQAMFPEKAGKLTVERNRRIGYQHGHSNSFYLWDYSDSTSIIVASSYRSWEHALAIAKSGDEDCWEEDDSPVEEV